MSAGYQIRCPVCLREMEVPRSTPVFKVMHCPGCGSDFEFQNALPRAKETGRQPRSNASIVESHEQSSRAVFLWSTPVLFLGLILGTNYSNSLDGPSFMSFILVVFAATFLASFLLRLLWMEIDQIRLVTFLFFEALCVYRLLWGYNHGMRRFGFLVVTMLVGGFLFFLRKESFDSLGGGWGGCGGGCGGCGG